jgi:hypothetical protein
MRHDVFRDVRTQVYVDVLITCQDIDFPGYVKCVCVGASTDG